MMIEMKKELTKRRELIQFFKNYSFKIKRTSQVVDETGVKLSLDHYEGLGKKNAHPMISVNAEESLVSLTTPMIKKVNEAKNYLAAIHEVFLRTIVKQGYLYPLSEALNDADHKSKGAIRLFLSVDDSLLNELFKKSTYFEDYIDYKNTIYQAIANNLSQYQWLIDHLLNYQAKSKSMVKHDSHETASIEMNAIDLNPFEANGISEKDLRLIGLLFLFAIYNIGAEKHMDRPAHENHFKEAAKFLEKVLEMMEELNFAEEDKQIVLEQIQQSENTMRDLINQEMINNKSLFNFAMEKGKLYHDQAWEKPFQLSGFHDMELSTQLMLASAIQKGISFQVLDKNDQFVKLYYKEHIEYVKNTNMTSLDTYISPLIMENKTVTKEILSQNGFRVPNGKEFSNLEAALLAYQEFCDMNIVVKPKSTNFGLGISIFEKGFSREHFEEAIKIAFSEDDYVLVEEFITGTEYRFYVLDGKVEAILLRVPANVVGDGKHTIKELVESKNSDPLRGTHHRAPLELIKLGDIELLMLKTQGYRIDDIPKEGETVYLRENSNVSTGGDSIDMTDDMDESYKKIAEQAVNALGAFVSGIDLMIIDKHKKTSKESLDYGIIEANFNPAVHLHTYPYQGKSRPLVSKMLDKLFPEVADLSQITVRKTPASK
ncbi:bifunctional glutamate--cysteine ligase GshA/glutathione synthetase GshB [Amphibacillus sp. Q70]|uniref:bifunctional glutamate--cysteine ligase GshA/glutathione synthetase GshB n=1 Tax=Amphibacillus sp. Q70 TaxID=3453416 RepID=UPI003F86CA08